MCYPLSSCARLHLGEAFVIKGSPRVERDFIYIDDVCDVFETSLDWRGETVAMNLCAGRANTLYELAETILTILGENVGLWRMRYAKAWRRVAQPTPR